MLRVDVQSFPVVVLSLLRAASQRAEIIHGAGVAGVQPERSRRKGEERRRNWNILSKKNTNV